MYKLIFVLFLFLFLQTNVFASDTTLIHKNIIGIDFIPFEGNNYNIFGGNFGMRYIRKLHKRADISTSLGIAYPVFPFGTVNENGFNFGNVYGRFTLVPSYVPLRRKNKTLELGVGYITDFHKMISFHGVTTQFNFLKESKKRRFVFGVQIYMNVLFTSQNKGQTYYGGGFGLFFGGFTGKKNQSK